MFRSLTIILSLLTWEERKRLLKLTPLMVISSVFDVAIVMVAANYFQVLADPEKLQQSALASWASESLGLQDSQIVVAGGALVLATVVLGNIYSVGVLHVVNLFSFSQIASVSERLLETYLTQPYSYFLSKSSSELVHRLMVEVSSVVSALIVQLSQVFARSLGALLMAGWLFLQDPVLGVLLAGVLGSFYVSVYSLLRGRLLLIGKTRSVNNKLRQQLATESLVGIKELKVLGLESQAVARFHVPSMAFVRSYALNTTIAGATKYLLETVGVGGVLVVVLYFLYTGQPLSGVLAILGAYAIAAYRLLPIFQAGFTTLSRIRFESHAAELIFNDLSLGIYANPKVLPVVHFKRSVRLNVGAFSYAGNDEKVLDKIDVTLKKRSWTALVGTTGSGKTTLVDVLLGLLSPDEGALEVDGKPIMSREEVHAWQKLIGYAPQGMFMADDTVARNIAFGTEPDMERVREVAQVASLDTFVEQDLSDGYDSMVGERGMRLSGGQVQRIGLARALYRKPELLVLDESTSALDNATEAKVMSALRSYLSDTTVVMVAHRLSTTRYCDRILILENGRVVDSGSYEELKANSQRFQVMLNASESV